MSGIQHTETYTDEDGDTLRVDLYDDGQPVLATSPSGIELTRAEVLSLYHLLGEYLIRTGDRTQLANAEAEPTCCTGEDDSLCCPAESPATILKEAQAAVYGDRQEDYGHPRRNFTRTAIGWQMVLLDKLAEGEHITPEDVALCMVQVKVAREAHEPKRDNRVDGAGYFACLDRLETGR